MTSVQDDKQRLLALIKEAALFRERITLSSGKQSDYYIDARRVTLTPEGVYTAARVILDMVKTLRLDAVGGPTLGADPMVGAIAALSFQQGRPLNTFIVRKAPKTHGKQQQVEGPLLAEGSRVVLIDDVATTGKAFIQALDVLKAMKVDVLKAICIVDRQEGAAEAVAASGCRLESVFTAEDILN